jgi:hypothetical protein
MFAVALHPASGPNAQADHVIVLKKERTLQLLREGKVIKTYKIALGGDPVGPKARQGDHKTPKADTFSTFAMRTVSSTSLSTSPTRVFRTASRRGEKASRREAMSSFMGCPTVTVLLAPLIG